MSCVNVPKVAIDLSSLLPSLPVIPLVLTPPGFPLPCCNLPPLPSWAGQVDLGAVLALLPGGGAVLAAAQSVIDQLNALIDQIPPVNCPDFLPDNA